MENLRWNQMSDDELRERYDQERQTLTEVLLRGAPWEEMQQRHVTLTQLSILLYKRITEHPAEHQRRSGRGQT